MSNGSVSSAQSCDEVGVALWRHWRSSYSLEFHTGLKTKGWTSDTKQRCLCSCTWQNIWKMSEIQIQFPIFPSTSISTERLWKQFVWNEIVSRMEIKMYISSNTVAHGLTSRELDYTANHSENVQSQNFWIITYLAIKWRFDGVAPFQKQCCVSGILR